MNAEMAYLSQDVVDTYIAVIMSAGIVSLTAIVSMLLVDWMKHRKQRH